MFEFAYSRIYWLASLLFELLTNMYAYTLANMLVKNILSFLCCSKLSNSSSSHKLPCFLRVINELFVSRLVLSSSYNAHCRVFYESLSSFSCICLEFKLYVIKSYTSQTRIKIKNQTRAQECSTRL